MWYKPTTASSRLCYAKLWIGNYENKRGYVQLAEIVMSKRKCRKIFIVLFDAVLVIHIVLSDCGYFVYNNKYMLWQNILEFCMHAAFIPIMIVPKRSKSTYTLLSGYGQTKNIQRLFISYRSNSELCTEIQNIHWSPGVWVRSDERWSQSND